MQVNGGGRHAANRVHCELSHDWGNFFDNKLEDLKRRGKVSALKLRAPMSEQTHENPDIADREIVSHRVIDAPRELVFRAFSEPEHLARWWGPEGFRNTIHEFDLRPGGHWRLTMHGPDGTDYPNESVFLEVAKPERVVFRHLDTAHDFTMTITLSEQSGKTALTWRMLFSSAAHCAEIREFVTQANQQNFDRLEAELAKM